MTTVRETSSASATWMEHTILGHVKQALRVTLVWKAPAVSMPRKLSSLQFTIKSFRRHLERVMSMEEEGGYLEEVADWKPRLQSRVDALAGDHSRFRSRVRRLATELDQLSDWEEERFQELCAEVGQLLSDIDRHDSLEVDLLQESLLLDEGGEG